jgi:protein SCO1/2
MTSATRAKFRRTRFTDSTSGIGWARLGGAAAAVLAALLWTAGSTARAQDAVDPHAHHHHLPGQSTRSTADYAIPDVDLTRDDGQVVRLRDELEDGRPVVLAFIYTSCTTVCPLTSHVLSDVQAKLGSARDRVHIMSVSIDPDYDTPARLREYAQRFGAGPEWQHYTGTLAASQTAQRAFGVYRGDKMDHAPATLVRPSHGSHWVRIDGFASADELLAELPDYQTAAR